MLLNIMNVCKFTLFQLIFLRIPKRNTIKIFAGNLAPQTTSSELRILFEQFGTVVEADCCAGFGFVVRRSFVVNWAVWI